MSKILIIILLAGFSLGTELFAQDTLPLRHPTVTKTEVDEAKKDLNFLKTKKRLRFKPRKRSNFNLPRQNFEMIRYILIAIICILIVALMANQIYNKDKPGIQAQKDLLDIDDIAEVNLHTLLNEAIENKNYRLALRIRFLIILQKLEEKKCIKWNKYKTNRKYIAEVPENLRPDFRTIAYTFDKVWYGNEDVDDAMYQRMASFFQNFEVKL